MELTKRELHVCSYLKQGLTSREIASELGVTEKTIKMYLTSCYKKLGVTNRGRAIVKLLQVS